MCNRFSAGKNFHLQLVPGPLDQQANANLFELLDQHKLTASLVFGIAFGKQDLIVFLNDHLLLGKQTEFY